VDGRRRCPRRERGRGATASPRTRLGPSRAAPSSSSSHHLSSLLSTAHDGESGPLSGACACQPPPEGASSSRSSARIDRANDLTLIARSLLTSPPSPSLDHARSTWTCPRATRSRLCAPPLSLSPACGRSDDEAQRPNARATAVPGSPLTRRADPRPVAPLRLLDTYRNTCVPFLSLSRLGRARRLARSAQLGQGRVPLTRSKHELTRALSPSLAGLDRRRQWPPLQDDRKLSCPLSWGDCGARRAGKIRDGGGTPWRSSGRDHLPSSVDDGARRLFRASSAARALRGWTEEEGRMALGRAHELRRSSSRRPRSPLARPFSPARRCCVRRLASLVVALVDRPALAPAVRTDPRTVADPQQLVVVLPERETDAAPSSQTLDGPITSVDELKEWNFDGSSTGQAEGGNSDVFLRPGAFFPDPFRRGNNIIVICETCAFTSSSSASRRRAARG